MEVEDWLIGTILTDAGLSIIIKAWVRAATIIFYFIFIYIPDFISQSSTNIFELLCFFFWGAIAALRNPLSRIVVTL
ncbi:hypothetical protein I7I48_02815 [Histoplasma ohiense]|nr:hypothetical protein I7I48_02815 [Histoplasma ohiense (nom. inval.)]